MAYTAKAERPMTFEEWLRRPVYVAQCTTWALANKLNLCSFAVRSLPGHRNATTQAARDMVAIAMREVRRVRKLASLSA